jgi:DNA-binding XRE family transcriptional regulator
MVQKNNIAKNLSVHRKKKKLSMDRLSKRADVSFQTVVKIGSGDTPNPRIETVYKIADALEITIDELVK